jgi:YD repeat-containing protein
MPNQIHSRYLAYGYERGKIAMSSLFIKSIVLVAFLCLLPAAPGLAGSAQYTYDSLNRLTQVQYDDGTTIQYTYDAVGNRLVKQVTVP